MLAIALLLAVEASAQAVEPLPTLQDVMYGISGKAVKLERLKQLQELIRQGADVNAPIGFDRMLHQGEDPFSSSRKATAWPLDVAVQEAQVDMVRLLLTNGAKFHGGELAQAAFVGNQDESLAMVTALIGAGADVNSIHDGHGHTALFWASASGNKNVAALLLTQPGIKLDTMNIDGDTALMAATEHGHAEIIEMLLKAGASVGIIDKRGETAVSLAQRMLARQQAIVERQQAMISRLESLSK